VARERQEPFKRTSSSRSSGLTSRLPAILLLVTAACVFAWGTSYKLSLYKSASEQGKMPEAKLCTRASEAAKTDVESSISQNHTGAIYSVFIAIDFVQPVVQYSRALPVSGPPPPAFFAVRDTSPLFQRPPPRL
jgi:hypothetical protein